MADRKRSQDGERETEKYIDDAATPGQQGRADGNLERKVGTRDLLKQAEQDKPGVTRVQKRDELDKGGS
ncbi:hypothetical protein [Marinovum sp.]|uniref:hypothetical protein n=1 Tax=Marinovum sp. TaxID=2024839 RepID=UPI002B26D236|nr:hypothetical protein [Marinovum sp.]